ncbi:MAG: hypothetical protein BGN93_21720, partial [Acinetobacter sp. 39-4]
LLFLLTGGIAATVNFGSRMVYNHWYSFSTAIILAYITGMLTAFILARIFVFKNARQTIRRSALFFIAVNLIAVMQTLLISIGLSHYIMPALGITILVKEIAHGVGVIFPVFTSYLGHKHWSFREH